MTTCHYSRTDPCYDNLHRVRTRTYPDTGVERFGYSQFGLVKYTNQLDKVTSYGYDAALRKCYETNANLEVTQFTYDAAGDLLTLTDGKSQVTTWNYDPYGLVTNKVDHTSTEVFHYTYDANLRLTNRWSAAKTDTYYAYDKVGNLTNITYPTNTAISLAYDALNRLTNMIDAVGTTKYGYDAAGQLLSEDGPWSSDTVSYSYANRLRSGMSLAQPNAAAWNQAYSYDSARRLTNTTSPAGSFGYAYDGTAQMLVKKLTQPTGAYITNTFDGNARVLATVLKNSGNTTLNSHSYLYNVGNQRTNQTFTSGNFVDYDYDNIGQLIAAKGKESGGVTNRLHEQMGYGYDAAHNLNYRTNNALVQTFAVNGLNEINSVTRNVTNALTVAGTTTSLADSVTVNSVGAQLYADCTFASTNGFTLTNGNNSFTAIAHDSLGRYDTNAVTVNLPATNSFTYDLNGNLTSDGKRAFDYDDENQLIRITATNAWKSEFTYDGTMRMRIRKEYVWNSTWLLSSETRYIYDGNLVIQERDQNNTPRVSYTRGTDLSGSLQGTGGIGGLLARTDHAVLPSGSHAYYHADGNGNVTALVNGQQVLAAKYHYDPFGNTLSQSGPLAEANVYRFSSKEFHNSSGLICYLYRFYSPLSQRWLNQDLLGENGGINLYRFARNDSISRIDPLGLTDLGALAAVESGVPSQAQIAAMIAEGNALLAPQAAVGPGVFGIGTSGVLATSVAEVGVGTIAIGGTVAVGVGGAIGLGASQLPVVGGGTVADFWGGVIYDKLWPKPATVPVASSTHWRPVSAEQLSGWVELPVDEIKQRCRRGKCSCVARCQNHRNGDVLGWLYGFASASDCPTAVALAVKRAANSAPQNTSTRHCSAKCTNF